MKHNTSLNELHYENGKWSQVPLKGLPLPAFFTGKESNSELIQRLKDLLFDCLHKSNPDYQSIEYCLYKCLHNIDDDFRDQLFNFQAIALKKVDQNLLKIALKYDISISNKTCTEFLIYSIKNPQIIKMFISHPSFGIAILDTHSLQKTIDECIKEDLVDSLSFCLKGLDKILIAIDLYKLIEKCISKKSYKCAQLLVFMLMFEKGYDKKMPDFETLNKIFLTKNCYYFQHES